VEVYREIGGAEKKISSGGMFGAELRQWVRSGDYVMDSDCLYVRWIVIEDDRYIYRCVDCGG